MSHIQFPRIVKRLNEFMTKVDLSELQKYILEHGEAVTCRRGEMICQEGDVCKVIAIVKSGYFQYSVINSKGENCITGFSMKGEIVTDYVGSFLFGMPAFTSIQAGCTSEIIRADIARARSFMADRHPDFMGSTSSVLLIGAYRRYLDLHTKTPKERYLELLDQCHDDLSMIPLQEIASYLSISRRQLQRIRESMV